MIHAPEFSRTVRLDKLGLAPHGLSIAADARERTALAKRFGLAAIESLEAEAELTLRHGDVIATGRLEARVTQSCVASGLPVEAAVAEDFTIIFRPEPAAGGEDEIELSEAECDVVFFEGGEVDLGEAVAETLSLSLDPYPRSAQADEALREAGVKSEAEAGAFGALAGLRDKLR